MTLHKGVTNTPGIILKRLNEGNQQSAKHVTSNLGNFIHWRKVDV